MTTTPAECDHCGETDRERDLAIARAALADGDVRHAAHHAASALSFDPNDAESLALVDNLIAWRPAPKPFGRFARMLGKAPASERALAFPTHPWWGNHLVRVRAACLDGERAEAFDTLIQIAMVAVHVDLSPWWNRILDEAEKNGERLPLASFLRAFSVLGQRTTGILHLRPAERAHIAPWAALGGRLFSHVDDAQRALLAMCVAGLLRRAGRFDEAVVVVDGALSSASADDAVNLYVQAGLALRGAKRFGEATAAFESAGLDVDKNHGVEIARVHADAGNVDDAIRFFDRFASEESGEATAMRDLLARRRGDEVEEHAHDFAILVDEDRSAASYDDVRRFFVGHTDPYVEMSDATASLVWQNPEARILSFSVSALEGPSARLAVALHLGKTDPRAFAYTFDAVPSPDPREPLDRDAGARLWRVDDDGNVVQALPPPTAKTVDQITSLALPLRTTQATWRRALALRGSIDGDDVVRALVHPPLAPVGDGSDVENAVSWLFRWQRCACLLLGAVDDGPWPASQRRLLLRSVLLSNPDWTTAAVVYALIEVALDDVDACDEMREWLPWLARRTPDVGHCCFASAVERAFQVLPGMPPDLLTPLSPWLDESSSSDA
jgi:hypothetical protein